MIRIATICGTTEEMMAVPVLTIRDNKSMGNDFIFDRLNGERSQQPPTMKGECPLALEEKINANKV